MRRHSIHTIMRNNNCNNRGLSSQTMAEMVKPSYLVESFLLRENRMYHWH
jgi:hypothetical protein